MTFPIGELFIMIIIFVFLSCITAKALLVGFIIILLVAVGIDRFVKHKPVINVKRLKQEAARLKQELNQLKSQKEGR